MGIGIKKNPNRADHTIEVDASMQGSLIFKDPVNLRISGNFEGSLEVKGNLAISDTASVIANIKGENITISGRVKGDINASSRIELLERAVVEGNIKTPRLVISDGAILQGGCVMLEDIIDAEELAKQLELDKETVIDWANNGKIPGFKEKDDWRFDRKRIDDWVASGRIG